MHWYANFSRLGLKWSNLLFSNYITIYILLVIIHLQINNNLRCYDLAMELSDSILETLPQNYAEQVFFVTLLHCILAFFPLSLAISYPSAHVTCCQFWQFFPGKKNYISCIMIKGFLALFPLSLPISLPSSHVTCYQFWQCFSW